MGSVCAGLGQALQQGWREGFPLQASPFQELARQTGASLRELLAQCQQLQRQGALQGLTAQWGPRVGAWRARGHVRAEAGLPPDPGARLNTLPGTAWVEQVEGDGWLFELQARSRRELVHQRAAMDAWATAHAGVSLQWMDFPYPQPRHCACGGHGGPCTDPDLARELEAGLPLCAHPFRVLGGTLGRSERDVLNRLRAWQEVGDLKGLSLLPPHRAPQQAVASALLEGEVAPERVNLLRQHAGVLGAQPVRTTAGPALWLTVGGPPELVRAHREAALQEAGLGAWPGARWQGWRRSPRAQALFFQPVV